MQSSQTRTLWISVIAALGAIFLLYSWSQEKQTELSKKFGATKRVVIASKDISQMETIDESVLDYVDRPVDFIQPDAVTEPEAAVGQVAAVPIKKGEQILQTKLLTPGPETGLSMEISPGKRGITIPVDDMRGVSRLLRPGDRIDIIAALDSGKGAEARREVRTIMQDVVVLATGLSVQNQLPRRFELDANGKTINRINLSANTTFSNITIEAKPDEVQSLVYILATSPGSLFTVLRHPNDRLQTPTRITTVEDVLGRPSVQRQPAQAPAVPPTQQMYNPPPQQQMFRPPTPQAKMPTSLPKKRGRFEEL
ncbi:MAG: Flp pilus assembly protein CpaB [Bdellovibrionota bacterium]